ncbi:MAG: GNAT family N-acetyltransferase, partial [Pseudomonadota bacterium]
MDRPDAAGPAGSDLVIRPAVTSDIASIVRLLADDPLGADREIAPDDGAPPDAVYVKAFAAIEADPNARVIVACRAEQIVGTLQLNLIAGLSRSGLLRGQIESVRVAASER